MTLEECKQARHNHQEVLIDAGALRGRIVDCGTTYAIVRLKPGYQNYLGYDRNDPEAIRSAKCFISTLVVHPEALRLA